MKDIENEGSLILEKLAEANLVEEFYSAVDSDDFSKIEDLLSRVGIENSKIQSVIQSIVEA